MQFQVNPAEVVHDTIDGEVILIQLKTGYYYSLEDGSEIWDALVAGRDPDEIVQLLGLRYEASPDAIEAAVSGLIAELRAERLIDEVLVDQRSDAKASTDVTGDGAVGRDGFRPPVLHRYTDMADFVLVDPIHEVESKGWPAREIAP